MADQKVTNYKELIKQEYIQCAKDPAYFMRKYVHIQHPMRGKILFNLYPFQEKVLHLFRDSKNIIVLKSRQLGISTLAAGYALWLITFHRDKNVLCLATTQATARNLVTKVMFAYDNLPKWLQVPSTEKNKLSMRLKNGSKIVAASSNADAARSEAVSLLLVDECLVGSQEVSGRVKGSNSQDVTLEQLFSLGELDLKGEFERNVDKVESLKELYGPDVEIRKLKNTKVSTPSGFKEVNYIKRIKTSGYLRITLDTQEKIECSDSHRVLVKDNHFVYASQLQPGDILFGDQEVISVEKVEEETYLYDLLDVDGNVYLTKNGVVNHNCAFIDNIEKTFASAQQTLATGGQAMLLSTPNGIGNFFHNTWVKAELGENTFVPVKLPWQVHPERDQAWRDKQDADLGPRYAGQECVSGDTLIKVRDKDTGTAFELPVEEFYKMVDC